MKAIVNTAVNRLEMQELPLPIPQAGQVLIKTVACGICATDLKMIAGWDRTGFPAVPGHEWAGIVDSVGPGVDVSLIGKKCVAENILTDGGEVGFEHPGGYARFFLTEAKNLYFLPDNFPSVWATMIEPLAVCLRGLHRLRYQNAIGPVLIIGDGPIGLLMAWLLCNEGKTPLTLIGGRSSRLNLAKTWGVTETRNYHIDPPVQPGGRYATIVEASGAGHALRTALDVAAPCGRILVIGDYGPGRADFPWNQLLLRELELIGSNASAGAWPQAVSMAMNGKIPLGDMISHRVRANDFNQGMAMMNTRNERAIKVVMEWDQHDKDTLL